MSGLRRVRRLFGQFTRNPDLDAPTSTDPHPTGGPGTEAEGESEGEGEGEGGEFGPEWVGVGARVVQTEGALVAVLAVTGYPAAAHPGWLLPLLTHPGRLDVSLHLDPVPPMIAADLLRKRRGRLSAGQHHDATHGRVADPNLAAAAEDADELAVRIARAQTSLFRVGLYLAIYAPDADTLADEVDAVRRLAASLMLDIRPASYRQIQGWQACLPFGLDPLGLNRAMDTDPIAASFPLASDELPGPDPVSEAAPEGVFYGFALDSNGLIFHDEFASENYNTVVLGPSGTGKSYLTKAILLRALYRPIAGHQPHATVIDPEDEYTALAHTIGGTVIRLGAPGIRLNPLDLPLHHHHDDDGARRAHPDAVSRRGLFLHTFLTVLLDTDIDPTTRAVLDEAITATYTRAGLHPDQPDTWTKPAPILADLANALAAHPDPTGPTLAAQLRPFTHGAWAQIFNGPTTTAPTGRLISWSLRELPDELRAPATLLVLDQIWRQAADPTRRRPRIVVIDEAWLFMTQPVAAAYLQRMAKSFRKYWASLRFVSQDIADALATELGQAILNNAATTVLMRQKPQTIDHIAQVYGLTAGEQSFLLRAGQGEALLITSQRRVAVRILASPVEHQTITTDPAELAELVEHDTDSVVDIPERDGRSS